MGPEILPKLLRRLLLACALLFAALPAHAAPISPACHGFADPGAVPTEWTCGSTAWTPTARIAWIRFDARAWRDGNVPIRAVLPISRFERLSVTALDADGRTQRRSYSFAEVEALESGPRMAVPLPRISGATETVMLQIDHAWNVHTLSGARLDDAADKGDPWDHLAMILLAMLAGLLCAPIIFDIAFYTALRERFLLWHAATTAGMLGHTLFATGLAVTLFGLSAQGLAILSPLVFSAAVAAAAFFSASFLESEALSPRMRSLLRLSGWWVLAVSCVLALQLPGLRELGGQAYHLSFQPTVIVFALTLALAARRGSRAARFQIAAWTPVLICGIDRLLRGIGLYALPALADQAIYFALALEVVITMVAVADRFFTMRRERDRALVRAEELEAVADRDPLTGLLNRRGFDARFAELAMDGYNALALLDLDHFKTVNDTHGHAIGDRVLRAVADALDPDGDTRAVRLGGEEFLLLLRGKDAGERAERRRAAIPLRVAAEVPGLDRMVTASMGLVEQVSGFSAHHDFALLYAHCDRLLYEAKSNGRNQTASERLKTYERRRRDRRGKAVQAA